jgi:hypothetical protein
LIGLGCRCEEASDDEDNCDARDDPHCAPCTGIRRGRGIGPRTAAAKSAALV